MRRPLALLIPCALLLAACGDDEENVGRSPAPQATEARTDPTQPKEEAGCEKVDEPKPKDVKKRKRPSLKIDRGKKFTAVLETSCGRIEIALDAKRAPKTVASFVHLARDEFFDGLSFHRIAPG